MNDSGIESEMRNNKINKTQVSYSEMSNTSKLTSNNAVQKNLQVLLKSKFMTSKSKKKYSKDKQTK